MKKLLASAIVAVGLLFPNVSHSQVFNQNQVIFPPFISSGIVFASSSAGNSKLTTISTTTLYNLLNIQTGGDQNWFVNTDGFLTPSSTISVLFSDEAQLLNNKYLNGLTSGGTGLPLIGVNPSDQGVIGNNAMLFDGPSVYFPGVTSGTAYINGSSVPQGRLESQTGTQGICTEWGVDGAIVDAASGLPCGSGADLNWTYNGSSSVYLATSTNRVGIGTTTPLSKLSVEGDILSESLMLFSTTATNTILGRLTVGTTTATTSPSPSWVSIERPRESNSALRVIGGNPSHAALEARSRDSSGGPGVIAVFSDEYRTKGLTFQYASTTNSFNIFGDYYMAAPSPNLVFGTFEHKSNHLVLSNDGNVGIASTTLSNRFEMSGNAFIGGNLTATGTLSITGTGTSTFTGHVVSPCFATSTNGPCIVPGGGGGGSGTVNSGLQGQVAWYAANGTAVSGTSTIFIGQTSNVGLGTTTAENKVVIDMPDLRVTTLPALNLANSATTTASILNQYSPAVYFSANSWATAGSNFPFVYRNFLTTSNGVTPSANLVWQVSQNSGAFSSNQMTLSNGGSLSVTGNLTGLAGNFTGLVTMARSSTGAAFTQVGGTLLANTSATVGSQVSNSPSLSFSGKAWNTTAGASRINEMVMGLVAVPGATTSSRLSIQNSVTDGTTVTTPPLFDMLSGGKAGFGTTSPSGDLSVHSIAGLPGSNVVFLAASSTSAGASTTTLMAILGNGRVGIGTINPAAGTLLDVVGNITSSGNITAGYGNFLYWGDTTTGIQGNGTTDFISFRTNAVGDRMRIDSSGNVGVGATTTIGANFAIHSFTGAAGTSSVFKIASSTAAGLATTTLFQVFGDGSLYASSTATSTFVGALQTGNYVSSDGTLGFTGTCTIVGLTSIVVKNGLIVSCI